MYAVGNYVIYGDSDVCRIMKIGPGDMKPVRESGKTYYFLETMFYKGMICAPVDTRVPMRPVIGRDEALNLIGKLPSLRDEVCASSDRKKLADHYDTILEAHDSLSLARTAKAIYTKYHAPGAKSKLPNSTEAAYYKKAGELLLQELSIALDEPIEAVQKRVEAVVSPDAPMKWSL